MTRVRNHEPWIFTIWYKWSSITSRAGAMRNHGQAATDGIAGVWSIDGIDWYRFENSAAMSCKMPTRGLRSREKSLRALWLCIDSSSEDQMTQGYSSPAIALPRGFEPELPHGQWQACRKPSSPLSQQRLALKHKRIVTSRENVGP